MHSIDRLTEFGRDWHFSSRNGNLTQVLPLTLHALAELSFRRIRYMLLAYPLEQPVPTIQPRVALELREFQRRDLEQVQAVQRPSEASLCRERLQRGHIGIVAHAQGTLAGHFWGCAEFDPELERMSLPLGAREIYMSDSFTVPAFRNKGVFTAMLLKCLDTYTARGFERAITCVDTRSPITPKVCLRVGFHEIGALQYTRVGMWRRVRWLQ